MCVARLVDMLKTNASHNLVQQHSSDTVNENVVVFFTQEEAKSVLCLDAAVFTFTCCSQEKNHSCK